MSNLEKLKTELAQGIYGITKQEAYARNICIDCKEPWEPKTHTDAGRREYRITAICEECRDKMFENGDD